MNIGFIGLGNMGSGMARNLLSYCQKKDYKLLVLDLNHEVLESFATKGAVPMSGVAALAKRVDLVFTSLPSSKQVNEVAHGEQGLLANLPAGACWFETSTNELKEWESVKQQAPEHLTLVDAPVTGGAEGAAAGTLTMLLGIDQTVLDQFSPVLESFTKRAIRMGPSGAGYVSKLCQLHLNYLVAQGIGEALMLGAKADLDLTILHQVLQNSCAQSYVVDNYIPKVLDGSYDPSFTLGLATKDMRLISELGSHLDLPLPLADTVYESYQAALSQYGDDEPHLKIVKLLEDQADQLLRS